MFDKYFSDLCQFPHVVVGLHIVRDRFHAEDHLFVKDIVSHLHLIFVTCDPNISLHFFNIINIVTHPIEKTLQIKWKQI